MSAHGRPRMTHHLLVTETCPSDALYLHLGLCAGQLMCCCLLWRSSALASVSDRSWLTDAPCKTSEAALKAFTDWHGKCASHLDCRL